LVVEGLVAALASMPLRITEAVTRQEKRVDKNVDCGLGAAVDAIRVAPKGKGKKKHVRWLDEIGMGACALMSDSVECVSSSAN
jgi:hypothetical protein